MSFASWPPYFILFFPPHTHYRSFTVLKCTKQQRRTPIDFIPFFELSPFLYHESRHDILRVVNRSAHVPTSISISVTLVSSPHECRKNGPQAFHCTRDSTQLWGRNKTGPVTLMNNQILISCSPCPQAFRCMLTSGWEINDGASTSPWSCHGALTKLSNNWGDLIAPTSAGKKLGCSVQNVTTPFLAQLYLAICKEMLQLVLLLFSCLGHLGHAED